MPDDNKLISKFQEAARIAESVPEQFRAAAFERALDALLTRDPPLEIPQTHTGLESVSVQDPPARETDENLIDRLLRAVDSSGHPEIHDASNLRDQCLILLRVIKSEYGADGLTTGEVETLLTSKFRLPAADRGIRRALASAGRLVDRVPEGKGFRYRIMEAGERHVESLSTAEKDQSTHGPTAGSRARKRRRSATRAIESVGAVADPTPDTDERVARRHRDATVKGTGPIAHVRSLIAAGWFSSPRSVQHILKELARRGAAYKRTDLTRQMINLVRSGELRRNKKAIEGGGQSVWHYSTTDE